MELIFCQICADELRIFVEAQKEARGYEVCMDCFYELGVQMKKYWIELGDLYINSELIEKLLKKYN